ncbi:hypothetical protein [Flavobacterium caeni]|uniref:hypothetical protein n=1 Tax=Flavobacterium caeni TaxID=490189 RepID=UPI000B825A9F|nr:hypothetical protein [Flavobacterium caeni]
MKPSKFGLFICLTIIAFTASFAAMFIGFFEGPQIAHYINLISFSLVIILLFGLIFNLIRRPDFAKKQYGIILLLFFGLSITFIANIAFAKFRYGYSSWEYKSITKIEFVDRRK